MYSYKFINRIVKAKAANKDSDFSVFLPASPLNRKQLLIAECVKKNISIYIDDTSEQSAGDYAILRGTASEAELERRLNARKAIDFSKCANVITLLVLIVSTITLVKSFM